MDDTAKRIHAAIVAPLEDALNARVDAATQFDVEEALGTIPESRTDHLHGMQQVEHIGASVEAAVADAMRGAAEAADQAAFVESIRRAVETHPRVQAAIKAVADVASEVARLEIDRLGRR